MELSPGRRIKVRKEGIDRLVSAGAGRGGRDRALGDRAVTHCHFPKDGRVGGSDQFKCKSQGRMLTGISVPPPSQQEGLQGPFPLLIHTACGVTSQGREAPVPTAS